MIRELMKRDSSLRYVGRWMFVGPMLALTMMGVNVMVPAAVAERALVASVRRELPSAEALVISDYEKGALTASRVIGFHFADLNSALQVMLAFKHVVLNLLIGTLTVFLLWWLLGGRTFCSWVCPYHLIAEWAEKIHLILAERKLAVDLSFHRGVRALFYLVFALLTLATGYTVFEAISPTGILSRALIYGPGVALLWVLALLLFEVFVSRRAWCRYVCPIGITYGLVGSISPLRVQYNMQSCHHEGDCRKICMVPHVLDVTIRGRATGVDTDIGADCTRCGLCVDICPTDSLHFKFKGLDKVL